MAGQPVSFVDLPDLVLDMIFTYLSYDDVARCREVCTKTNVICKRILNRGLLIAYKKQYKQFKALKEELPKRESMRYNHPLAQHYLVLSSLYSRIKILRQTYGKFMEKGLCCFIPGKILDELFMILRLLDRHRSLPTAVEILQELKDLMCMALEHFEDYIWPDLNKEMLEKSFPPDPCNPECPHPCTLGSTPDCYALQKATSLKVLKLQTETVKNKLQIYSMKRQLEEQGFQFVEHKRRCDEQNPPPVL